MIEIKWNAPKDVYKQLNGYVEQIKNLIKQRESKSFHNIFTTNKKLNIELNKKLDPIVKNVSSLFCHYAADSSFSTLCLQLDKFLQSYKKKYEVNIFIKVPNVTPYYQTIQKNLNKAEEIKESIITQTKNKIDQIKNGGWKENLDKVVKFNQNNLKEVSEWLEDIENKSANITNSIQNYTIVKDEFKAYIFPNESNDVDDLKKCFEEWDENSPKFINSANFFLTQVSKFDVDKIKSEADENIAIYENQITQKISELDELIISCAKSCQAQLSWDTIKDSSEAIIKKAKTYDIFNSADIRDFDAKISKIIDKDYDTLCNLKNSINDTKNTLVELYNKINSLTSKLAPLQSSLQTRIDCKKIFVFDKHASSTDENNAENLKRRKDTSKLQSVFDIVFKGQDIKKQNLVPYIFGSAAWILIDKQGNDVKKSKLKMPYTKKDDFQKDLRTLYNK